MFGSFPPFLVRCPGASVMVWSTWWPVPLGWTKFHWFAESRYSIVTKISLLDQVPRVLFWNVIGNVPEPPPPPQFTVQPETMVYDAVATAEVVIPDAVAIALTVVFAATVIGPVNRGEPAPGVLPTVVYRMTAPGVAEVSVTAWVPL